MQLWPGVCRFGVQGERSMRGTIEKYLVKIREATSRPGTYAYRGQEDSQCSLHSGATRRLRKEHGDQVLNRADFTDKYLKYHREALVNPARARGFDVEHGRRVSDLQLLSKLQHFHAATGLLDFTWSPLVALWFASQDPERDGQLFTVNTLNTVEVSLVPSNDEAQNVETIFSRADDASPRLLYWEPLLSGDAMPRVLRQRSVFIIGRPLIPEESAAITKIQIAKGDKVSLLRDLECLDVSRSSLFQDIYGFAEAEGVKGSLRQIPDPNDRLLHGNQLFQQGDYLKAIEAYSECIELEPSVCETYFLRGNAKAACGDHKEAIEDYDKAVSHKNRPFLNFNPDTTNLIFNPILFMVYFNRGNVRTELKDYAGALQDYNDAIQSDQSRLKNSGLYFNRANTYADLHKFDEAVAEYDKVIEFGSHDAHFNKGNVLVVLGRFGEALQCYQDSALKATDRTKNDQNISELERIIHRIHGHKYRTHFEASGPGTRVPLNLVSVTVVGDQSNTGSSTFLIVGNAGNIGNFGGRGLPGGKGFGGKLGFVVSVGAEKGNQG